MTKQWLIIRPQVLPISFHCDRRVPGVLLILTLIILVAMVISVGYGEYPISPIDVVKISLGLPTANGDYAFVINTLRLPRTLVAFLVGVGLAIAGTITQGITRNPLAAPDIIGVNAGAALAAVTLIILLPNTPVSLLPFAAFTGALTVALLIYLLAWQRGLLLLTSVALAGSSVATAGKVGFVGLMAPHLGRQLVGASHEGLLPIAAMMGGMLVVGADLLGRVMFTPLELPCGIIAAAIGAPYFVYLLIKNRQP